MIDTAQPPPVDESSVDSLFSSLAQSDCRRVLGFLYEYAPDSLTRRDLATNLVQQGSTGAEESPRTVEKTLISLHHKLLPKLEAAGLVEETIDQEKVGITEHRAFQDTGIIECITTEKTADSTSLDLLFDALVESRRRMILDVLSHQFQPIHLETLARELAAKEQGLSESEVPKETVKALLINLQHTDLPRLDDAGLIEYKHDPERVSYDGHPRLRVAWMHSVLTPYFRATLTDKSEPQEIGSIDGREKVISYGQSLGERADEELFCMFTHTDMMEAGCFTRILEAASRGVDVYIGTYDPTIREYVRENMPKVRLWEPKTDWLNLPVEGNRVGRLLMADREAVMVGTLDQKTDDDFPAEKAIIGEGTDNTLVVMVQQMLSAHLEQIDDQTTTINEQLHF